MRLIQGGWPFNHPPNMPFTINLESPQARGLVMWMPFGPNTSSEPYVDRVKGLKFTEGGTPVWVVDGERGWSLEFDDGSSEYLEVLSTPVQSSPITICCWFNTNDDTIQQNLISIQDNNTGEDWLRIALMGDAGDVVRLQPRSSEDGLLHINTTTTFSANKWQHACGVKAAVADHRVYLNAGGKATDNGSVTLDGLNSVSIGRIGDSSPGTYMSGRITDVRIYNRALTDNEVKALYDPATRWQLYKPVVPNFAVIVTAVGPIAQAVAGAITPSGALLKLIGTDKAGVTGPSGATVKETATSKLGTLSFSGALGSVKAIVRALTGAISPAGALIKDIAAVPSGIVGPGGAVIKETATSKLGTLSFSGALGGIKAALKALTGAIGPSGALIKQIGKGLAGVVDAAGAPGKGLTTSLGGVLSFAGALSGILSAIAQAVGGAIGPSGTITVQVGKGLAGVVAAAGEAGKGLTTSLGGVLSFGGALAGVLVGAYVAVVDLTLKTRDITLTLKDRIFTFLAISDR